MNNQTNATQPAPKAPRRLPVYLKRVLVAGLVLAPFVLVAVVITGFFTLGRDARSLRNSLTQGIEKQGGSSTKRIELRAGALVFQALRTGLSFAPLNAEAHQALRALRGAEVGLYRLGSGFSRLDDGALLQEADLAMTGRGWERLVGVTHGTELVAVYVPAGAGTGERVQACVAVLNRDELIVFSARTDLAPLIELANSRPDWSQQARRHVRL